MAITVQQAESTLENVLFESPTLAAATAASVNLSSYANASAFASYLATTPVFGIVSQVIRYYTDALGRIPAGSEIAYYVQLAEDGNAAVGIAPLTAAQIATGQVPNSTWSTIATFFASSTEFQKDFGLTAANSVTTAQQVTMIDDLYSNILGRTGSASEVAYYVAALNNGFKPSDLIQFFSNSPEFLSDASATIQADVVTYANAIASGTATSTTVISTEPLVTPVAVYNIAHDSQASITEGGTETFTISTGHVAAGTTLYYTLSGVTAAEVVGGNLTGTVTVTASGDATLTVSLTSTAGLGLMGDLTATIATSAAGSSVASASVPLAETAVSGLIAIGNLGGGAQATASYAINDSGVIVGLSGTGGSGTSLFRVGAYGPDHAFIWQNGTLTDLGTLPGYGSDSKATAINNAAEVVGWSVAVTAAGSTSAGEAFLYQNGTMTDLGTLGVPNYAYHNYSQATGINTSGQIVGESDSLAFIWQPTAPNASTGTMTSLGLLPGYTSTSATAVNHAGEVVGYASTTATNTAAFLWSPTSANANIGTMINLGALTGDTSVEALAINNSGEVIGTSTAATGVGDGWVWQPTAANGSSGSMTKLAGLMSRGGVAANALNDAGLIVGQAQDSDGYYHAVVWQNGAVTDLNSVVSLPSGWLLTDATAINNSDVIAVVGLHDGVFASYELTLPSITSSISSSSGTITVTAESGVGVIAPVDPTNTATSLVVAGAGGADIASVSDTALTSITISASGEVTLGSAANQISAASVTLTAAANGGDTIYDSANLAKIDASATTGANTLVADGQFSTVLAGTGQTTVTLGPVGSVTFDPDNSAANIINVSGALVTVQQTGGIGQITLGTHDGGSTIVIDGLESHLAGFYAQVGNEVTNVRSSKFVYIENAADGLTQINFFGAAGTNNNITTTAIDVSSAGNQLQAANIAAAAMSPSTSGDHSYNWFVFGGNVWLLAHNGAAETAGSDTDVLVELIGVTTLSHFAIGQNGNIIV